MKKIIYLFTLSILVLSSCKKDTSNDLIACFEFAPSNPTLGSFINFSNCSKNETNYLWDFGDGAGSSTEKNPTYYYLSVGTFNVKLTVSKAGKTKTVTKQIVIEGAKKEDIIGNYSFSVSCSSSGNYAYADTVVFNSGSSFSLKNFDDTRKPLAIVLNSNYTIDIPTQTFYYPGNTSPVVISGTGGFQDASHNTIGLTMTFNYGSSSETCTYIGRKL